MRRIAFPNTDLQVAPIVMGSTDARTTLPEDEVFDLFDAYFEAGGNFLDTAHVYAVWRPNGAGASERTVGQWIRTRGVRDQVTVATKGAHPFLDSMHVPRLSQAEIESDLNESLERLGVDVIDLYWLHRDAVDVPVEDIVGIMDEFVRAGKIRYWGGSNWTPERISAANLFAKSYGLAGLVASQPLGSLAKANMAAIPDQTLVDLNAAALEFHRETGLPVVPYTSQAKGYFTKRADNRLKPDDRLWFDNPTNDRRFERVRELAQRYSTTITAVALAYLTSQSFPCTPIIGPRNVTQLRESLAALDLTLTPEDIAYLEVD